MTRGAARNICDNHPKGWNNFVTLARGLKPPTIPRNKTCSFPIPPPPPKKKMASTCSTCSKKIQTRSEKWRPFLCEHWFHLHCLNAEFHDYGSCPICDTEIIGITCADQRSFATVDDKLSLLITTRRHNNYGCAIFWLCVACVWTLCALAAGALYKKN